jgi:alkylhydroperoxidase family enzyme
VLAIQRDYRSAGLPERDLAMLSYAEKIATEAHRIVQADIDRLRAAGFSDLNISDIALCASFRCFLSKFVDATGAVPEPAFHDSDEAFRTAMTVGRPLKNP